MTIQTQDADTLLRRSVFIEVDELARILGDARQHVVLLDVRLDEEGRQAYLREHAEGAVYVDLAESFAGKQEGFSGKRPLPQVHDLQRDARRWGIRNDSLVVLYDDNGNRQAARGWWTLRWAGLDNVVLLDGGLGAWRKAALPVNSGVPLPELGDVNLSAGHLPVLDADGAAEFARSATLIDARGASAYRGEDSGGHIPGALNYPTSENLDAEGRFLPADELRQRFRHLASGADRLGIYCGGGVAASHQIAALASIGITASLFPGSWSAWSSDPARPVAAGGEPG